MPKGIGYGKKVLKKVAKKTIDIAGKTIISGAKLANKGLAANANFAAKKRKVTADRLAKNKATKKAAKVERKAKKNTAFKEAQKIERARQKKVLKEGGRLNLFLNVKKK